MKKRHRDHLRENYLKMLAYQEQIKPFTPSIRELMEVFGISSTSVTSFQLRKMKEKGWVIEGRYGTQKRYYAIKEEK